MKLNAILMAGMLVGALGVTGCRAKPAPTGSAGDNAAPQPAAQATPENIAPEESPANAPVQEAKPGFEQDAFFHMYYAPRAPPPVHVEVRGAAPGPNHFWAPGYYRWTGRDHVWVGGSWVPNRTGFEYVGPRWYADGPRWRYTRAYWVRRY